MAAPAARAGRVNGVGVALVVLSACAFGSGALFAKPVYVAGMDWIGLLAWRFLFGAAVAWGWLLARRSDRRRCGGSSRRRMLGLLALGALYVTNSGTYYAALETVPASLAAVIVYIYPALVAVLALRWGRRLPGRRPWIALAVATFGVLLAVGGAEDATPPISGIALAIASPIIYAVWIILSARLAGERPQVEDASPPEAMEAAEETDPAPAATLMMTTTWAIYFALATATGRPTMPWEVPAGAWVGLIGIGVISTAIAIQTFYAGTRRVAAAQDELISTIEPIYTITLAVLLFGETLTRAPAAGRRARHPGGHRRPDSATDWPKRCCPRSSRRPGRPCRGLTAILSCVRLISVSDNGEERVGVVVGERATPAVAIMNSGPKTMADLLAGGSELLESLRDAAAQHSEQIRTSGAPLEALTILAPVPRPGKVVAIGLNYHAHAIEQNVEPPTAPLIFTKFPTSVIGTGAAITWDPALTSQVDYEAELAVIVGRSAHKVTEASALEYVLGYTYGNDVTARDLQFGDRQWVRGKSLDTFCPLGPWMVTRDEIPDPQALRIRATSPVRPSRTGTPAT